MGTISSGVGLISGIPIQDIVDQLMAIEARSLVQLQQRQGEIDSIRTAFMELSARLLALKTATSRLDEQDFFRQAKVNSSNENVMLATVEAGAAPGTYTFQVRSLVTTHQLISRGYADQDRTPVGAGVLTVETGGGDLAGGTALETLNGQRGVRVGTIRITDRSGASSDVDLSAALTVDEVLRVINSQTAVGVRASVAGDRLVLTDVTGQTTGNLTVQDIGGGYTAADLGIAGSVASETLVGQDVHYITDETALSLLNDGNGIGRAEGVDDFRITLRDGTQIDVSLSDRLRFETSLAALNSGAGVRLGTIRITDREGTSTEVDLSGAQSIRDVTDALSASGANVTVSLVGSHLLLTDGTGNEEGEFKVEDVDGYAARDLGIAGQVEESAITGSDIYRVATIGDVVRAINHDSDNTGALEASLSSDGARLVLEDTSWGSGAVTVEALNDSQAAGDLGILGVSSTGTVTGQRLLGGLNTVLIRSLNGGSGVDLGTVQITDRSGAAATVDLSNVETVWELLDALNGAGVAISAGLNGSGTRLVIADGSGGTGNLVIEDVSGSAAADLGIAVNDAVTEVSSGNLQLQYISEATRLEDLNGGRGVGVGKFRVTDSSGQSSVIDVTGDDVVTLGDLIRRINGAVVGVEASINATGDGLLLTDVAGGTGRLKVEDEGGGRVAGQLRIAAEAAEGESAIDGSFELRIELDGDDTLADVVAKINSAGGSVSASLINDGSSVNPYRLTLRSEISGTAGRMVFDVGQTGLGLNTLIEAQDAVVFLGGAQSQNPVVISSSSNSLSGVIDGVTLDLVGVSSGSVTVSVAEDMDSVCNDMGGFVDAFNSVIDRMNELTSFDTETMERGLLLGDPTIERIRRQLYNMVSGSVDGSTGRFTRLNQVGVTIGSGARLQFDEQRFRDAHETDPESVEELFVLSEAGLGVRFDSVLESLTDKFNGLLARKDDSLEKMRGLYGDRIESMQELLDSKEQRLLAQFHAMESALAQMQSQQSALSSMLYIPPGSGGLGLSTSS